jgi:hypothetical protein
MWSIDLSFPADAIIDGVSDPVVVPDSGIFDSAVDSHDMCGLRPRFLKKDAIRIFDDSWIAPRLTGVLGEESISMLSN